MKNVATYPLRLPRFLKEAVARIASDHAATVVIRTPTISKSKIRRSTLTPS